MPSWPSFPFWRLYSSASATLSSPAWNDTEEKLLNRLLPSWLGLPPRFNLQKRAYHHAPRAWNDAIAPDGKGAVVLHYVGGKPWSSREDLEALDWEQKEADVGERYGEVFGVWRDVMQERSVGVPRVPLAKV